MHALLTTLAMANTHIGSHRNQRVKWILQLTQWHDILRWFTNLWSKCVRNTATERTRAQMKNDLGKCDVRRFVHIANCGPTSTWLCSAVGCSLRLLQSGVHTFTYSISANFRSHAVYSGAFVYFLHFRLWFSGSVNCTCACVCRRSATDGLIIKSDGQY